MASSTNRASQAMGEGRSIYDPGPRQKRRSYHNRGLAKIVTRKAAFHSTVVEISSLPRRAPISSKKVEVHHKRKAADAWDLDNLSIIKARNAVLRKSPPACGKHQDAGSVKSRSAIESISAVKAEVLTRSYKGGWRRREWQEKEANPTNDSTRPTDSVVPSDNPEISSTACCEAAVDESETDPIPSIVVLAPGESVVIKQEPNPDLQPESCVWVASDVDQSEWEQSEMSSDFENLSLSDVSCLGVLPSQEDMEMEAYEGGILSVPDSPYSDESDMEGDSYWEWDRSRRQFRHWDEIEQKHVYCPVEFS